MNIFESRRQDLRNQMDHELGKLDSLRHEMSDAEYWRKVSAIHSRYSRELKDVDEAERTHESLIGIKEKTHIQDRPEATYADVLGQLKAEKETEMLLQLSQLDSGKVKTSTEVALDMKDPFYFDKKDPLSVFNRWWVDFVSTLPSVDEVRAFLRKIKLDEFGVIYFDEQRSDSIVRTTEFEFQEMKNDALLRAEILKTNRQRMKEIKEEKARKMRLRSPLLANDAKFNKSLKAKDKAAKTQRTRDALYAIVDAYGLPENICDLLYEHIDKVCVPSGMIHVDKYKNMLEQFLRNVEPYRRESEIKRAISRRWRSLYYVQ